MHIKNTEIPQWWVRVKLGDLVDIKYGKDHKHLNNGDIPVYGSGGIMRLVDNFLRVLFKDS